MVRFIIAFLLLCSFPVFAEEAHVAGHPAIVSYVKVLDSNRKVVVTGSAFAVSDCVVITSAEVVKALYEKNRYVYIWNEYKMDWDAGARVSYAPKLGLGALYFDKLHMKPIAYPTDKKYRAAPMDFRQFLIEEKFKSGGSGGPVLNKQGQLIGIVLGPDKTGTGTTAVKIEDCAWFIYDTLRTPYFRGDIDWNGEKK